MAFAGDKMVLPWYVRYVDDDGSGKMCWWFWRFVVGGFGGGWWFVFAAALGWSVYRYVRTYQQSEFGVPTGTYVNSVTDRRRSLFCS